MSKTATPTESAATPGDSGFNLSRRHFVAGTGAMVVALSLPRLLNPNSAFAQATSGTIGPATIDATQVDSWLAIRGDGTVVVQTGKVELGTGVLTTTTQLVADELDVAIDSIQVIQNDTWITPNQGGTSGSQSNLTQFKTTGGMRAAAAQARVTLLDMASAQLGVPASSLSVSNGVVSGGGKTVSYAQLIGNQKFNLKISGKAAPKTFEQYKIVGTSTPRIELPEKAYGTFEFTQYIKLPGMVHARMVEPPTVNSNLSKVVGFPHHKRPPGFLGLVAKDNFVAVVAEQEYQAIQAMESLQVKWDVVPLPSYDNLYGDLKTLPATTDRLLIDTKNVDKALADAPTKLTAEYHYPIQMHGSMGTSASVADVTATTATVYSSTQDVYALRAMLATALNMPAQNVHVIYVEGSGCYGINRADCISLDAAIVSQQIGKPVRMQYMRAQEHGYENYGQPYVHIMNGGLDASGKVSVWDVQSYTASRGGRPGPPQNIPSGVWLGFVEAPQVASPASSTPSSAPNSVDGSNSGPSYIIPNQRMVTHSGRNTFFGGPLRSPNRIQNTYANECFMDELAHAAGADPIAFRVAQLNDDRLVYVINQAAKSANWQPKVAGSQVQSGRYKSGRGMSAMLYEGDNGYNALITDVTVDTKTGKVVVDAAYTAQDCGPAINPDGMKAQAEGCLMQSISRALIEELKWKNDGVTSIDWETYPVARFLQMPKKFEFSYISRLDEDVWGAGEVTITNGPAAIANAIFDATGVRFRELPMTPKRIMAGLKAAGVATA